MNDIQNPLKLNIILSLVASVLGVLVVFVPGMVADIGPYQFYCNYFGIILIAGGILFAVFYFKRYKAFESFMKSDEEKSVGSMMMLYMKALLASSMKSRKGQ